MKNWGSSLELPEVSKEVAQERFLDTTDVKRALKPAIKEAVEARDDMLRDRFNYVDKHLGANTASLIVLGTLVALRGPWVFTRVSLHVMVVAGAAMWILARSANHIGASGVIFGFLGFLLSIGIFERKLGSTLLSVVVGALYGGMIWGVLPGQPGISWEGHLFGFLGGIHAARVLGRRRLSQETAEA